jgi:molybdopterin-guanine dinucleotide biosynthesis protein A
VLPEPLAAVVLAGGASRRMGRDKATMPHPGRPDLTMVEHTVVALAGRCAPVFVVAAPGQPLPAMDARIIDDPVRGVGPLLAATSDLAHAVDRAALPSSTSLNLLPELDDE